MHRPHHLKTRLAIATLMAAILALVSTDGSLVQPEPAVPSVEIPPARRMLAGENARRVEILERRITEMEQDGQFAEAQVPAREVLEIRNRSQGANHWQTVDARWLLWTLLKVAALPAEEQARFASAVKLTADARELFQQRRYDESANLFEQTRSILSLTVGEDHPDWARFFNSMADHYYFWGGYVAGENASRTALEIFRRTLGEDHPDTARSYRNLAANLQAQGKHADAQILHQKAVDVHRRVLGEYDPDTACSCYHLALNLEALGRDAEAQPLYREAIAIRRRVQGEDHPATVHYYLDMTRRLQSVGRYAEAEELYREALANRRQALGACHPLTIESYKLLAYNLYLQDRFAEVGPLFLESLTNCRRELGETHPLTIDAYELLANTLMAQARYTDLEALYRERLSSRRRALGEGHPYTIDGYNKLVEYLTTQRRYDEAEELARAALAICRRVLGEEHPETARSYYNLANCLGAQSQYSEAKELQEKALAIRRRVLGEDHPDTTRSRRCLASNLYGLGRYADAEPLFRHVLTTRIKVLGREHADTARSYCGLGLCLQARGLHAEAERLFKEALSIFLKVQGEDHWDTATSYYGLASSVQAQGRYAEAEEYLRKSLYIRIKVLGPDHPDTAESYNGLAGNLQARGRYAEAELPLERAFAIRSKALGEGHPDVAACHMKMAENLRAQGRYSEAEPHIREALDIRLKTLGADHPHTATCYISLASNLQVRGSYPEAEDYLLKALVIRRKPGANPSQTATCLACLAYNFRAQRKYPEAEPLYREALDIQRRTLGKDHPGTATSCNSLAANLRDQGRHDEAEPLLREALDIRLRMLGEDHPRTVESYTNLAANLLARGQLAEAEAMWVQAARGFEVARRRVGHSGRDRAAFAAARSPMPPLAAMLARRGQSTDAWRALEAGVARGLFDDLARPLKPEEIRHEEDLLARLQELDERIASLAAAKGGEEARQRRVKAVRERDALRAELAEFEAGIDQKYGAEAGQPYELATIQHSLPEDAALVGWLDLKASPGAADPDGEHWACVIRRRGEPTWVKLPGSGPDGRWTADDNRLPVQVRDTFITKPDDPSASWSEVASRLAAQRLAPLRACLNADGRQSAARHLIVLPSRQMAGVPVEALVESQPVDAPRYTVSYAPSGTMFAWLRERRARKDRRDPTKSRRLLALGDPEYATGRPIDSLLATTRGESLARLPGTRVEVQTIAEYFVRPEVLVGPNASEQKLAELVRSGRLHEFDYLHLATHGQMDPKDAECSRLFLAEYRRSYPTERVLDNRDAYDGEVTAEQIRRTWRLNAELVTLSACQSGLGRQGGGEGYLGFSQVLFLAGAQSMVLSLWKVDDQATALLMERFYGNLLGRRKGLSGPMPKAAALREAKQWLRTLAHDGPMGELAVLGRGAPRDLETDPSPQPRKEDQEPELGASPHYAHPYYWAGFILIGDPF